MWDRKGENLRLRSLEKEGKKMEGFKRGLGEKEKAQIEKDLTALEELEAKLMAS